MDGSGVIEGIGTRKGKHARKGTADPRLKKIVLTVLCLPVIFLVFRAVTTLWVLAMETGWIINIETPQPANNVPFFLAFPFFFWPLIYLFHSGLFKKWVPIDWPRLIMYMGTVYAIGLFGEIVGNTLWNMGFGKPLWLYRIWPVHKGYTSGVSAIMWPLYGFHLYCLHRVLEASERMAHLNNDVGKGLILGVDALIMEALANMFSLSFFNTYYFYYLPEDLHHFASVQNFPAYFLCGIVAIKIFNAFNKTGKARIPLGLGLWVLCLILVFIVF